MRLSQSSLGSASTRIVLVVMVLSALATGLHTRAAAEVRNIQVVADAAKPGELIEETPTLKCLGMRWQICGDGNANARVAVAYRKVDSQTWNPALDLFRVETAAIREPNRPPVGRTLSAGSVFDLDEDTEYEVKLSLKDPDGGDAERIVKTRTWSEPRLSAEVPTVDVSPGQLAAALSRAEPGQVLRLQPGIYHGTFRPRSGAPGKPIGIVGVER